MQRRLDGVREPPFKDREPEPKCDDCGVTEGPVRTTPAWPDGKVLRKYADGYGCQPCSNGESEKRTYEFEACYPTPGEKVDYEYAKGPVFPKFKVAEQESESFKYVPGTPWDAPCSTPIEDMREVIKKIKNDYSGYARPDQLVFHEKALRLAEAYSLSDAKRAAILASTAEMTGIPAHMWELPVA